MIRKLNISIHLLFLPFALVLIFAACIEQGLYDKYVAINPQGWNFQDPAVFEVEITDTVSAVNFFLNIRHNTDYEFRNLYLFLHTKYPSGQHTTDTLEIMLAAPDGKWFGKGYGKIKEDRILLKKGVYFEVTGKYTFRLEQAMREENLSGIEDIGITIKKFEN